MKKTVIILTILAAALSCAKEASVKEPAEKNKNVNLVEMSFTVSSETKAVLKDDYSVEFVAGDKISIFANGTNYQFTTAEGGANAVFTGTGEEADTYYALYPYTEGATISEGTIQNVSISTGSDGTGTGTFNSKRAVAVAISNSKSLTFKQVTALLKLTVPAEVTDLKEIVFFNRDNGSSNKAGAITGTFNVTPVDGDAPTYEVTTAGFQAGFVGPNGSSNPVPAGDYFIPVLPAQLTAKKGIDLKLTFFNNIEGASGKDGRAFNGTGLKLERGKVYNLGVVKKTAEFVYDNFESGTIAVPDNYAGNTNALSVIDNPVSTDINSSAKVLKNDMSGSSSSTSGYIDLKTGTDAYGYIKFPSSVRDKYDKIRMKIYLGTNAYYPRLRRGSNTAALPAKLNGAAITDEASWNAAVKTDDWNVLEWNASQIDGGWTNWSNMSTLQLRPFVQWSGENVSGFDDVINNRLIYIDDITFVLK